MPNLKSCNQQPCPAVPSWHMVAPGGFVTGVLCDYHKESWYDARDDHKTTLEKIQQQGGKNEMVEGHKMDRTHEQLERSSRTQQANEPWSRDSDADGMESRLPGDYRPSGQKSALTKADRSEGQGVAFRLPAVAEAQEVGHYGALGLGDREQLSLRRPVDPSEVEIRPDGIVYTPWSAVANRLDEALGVGEWALVPDGKPQIQDGYCCWQFHLFVHGQWVATAIGEHPDSKFSKMSLANRAESAKSDALVKCSKALGIFRELWSPGWRADWQNEYAERVWALANERSTAGQWLWRRKDRRPFFKERPAKDQMETEYNKRRDYNDDARDHMDSITSDDYTAA